MKAMKLAALGVVMAAILALPAAAASPETRTITVVGNGEAEPESVRGDWTLVVSVEHENPEPLFVVQRLRSRVPRAPCGQAA
jgi:uncharacterized protein YggE